MELKCNMTQRVLASCQGSKMMAGLLGQLWDWPLMVVFDFVC